MSTNNGPMPPANPYDGGNINPDSTKKSKPHRQRRAPLPFKKNTGFYIFFLDCLKNSPLFSLAAFLVFSIFILSIIELWISFTHLAEYQKLLEKNLEPSTRDMENINSLRNWFSLLGFVLPLLVIAFFSCLTKSIMKILDQYPQRIFIFIMILGGVSAFFIPQFLYSFKYIGETKDITTTLLTVTGGVLAIFTLLKTHQKNILDKETLDFERQKYAESIEDRKKDIAKQEKLRQEQKSQFNMTLAQQKDKDSQEHIRQVHAERRARYAKAIEQLADDKAAIRLGGIYTLVGLVDEWLTDESISDSEKRKEEGQTIINNICAYIQSMPENCTEHDLKSNNAPSDEANVRQLLFGELKTRTKYMKNYTEHKNNNESLEQSWGVFNFNFANAPIFYPLDGMHFPNADFSHANFYSNTSFKNSKWINAKIENCTFHSDINFEKSKFHGFTNFSKSAFYKALSLYGAHFYGSLRAEHLRIHGVSDFSTTEFHLDALFTGSYFHMDMEGREKEKIDWIANDYTKFWNSRFKKAENNINIITDFRDTRFFGFVDFYGTHFEADALFRDSKFMQGSKFERVEFTSADFKNSRFHWNVNFQRSSFSKLAYFVYSAGNFKDDTFFWAEFIYSTDHHFDFIHLGYIPKDKNFKNEYKEYPLGSTAYILKGKNKISSDPARAISQSHKMLGNMNTIFP